MVTPINLYAFKVTITNADLIQKYADYVNVGTQSQAAGLSKEQQKTLRKELFRRHYIIESSIAQFQGLVNKGGNKRLVPDFSIQEEDLQAAYAKIFRTSKVTSIEAKLKRGGSTTNVGQISVNADKGLVNSLKEEAYSRLESDDDEIDIFDPTVIRELNRNLGEGTFRILQAAPKLFNAFYEKSKILQIITLTDNKEIELLNIAFPKKAFKLFPFGAFINPNTKQIRVFIQTRVEKEILSSIRSANDFMAINSQEEFAKGINAIAASGRKKIVNKGLLGSNLVLNTLIPTGGSIPMSTAKVKKKAPGASRSGRKLPATGGVAAASLENTPNTKGKFISSAQLSLLIRNKVKSKMPIGPIGGPPLSPDILTYRTGRFVTSINVMANYRDSIVKYIYNPIYTVHRATGRNPDDLIGSSIREVVQQLYGRKFKILPGV